MIYIAIFTHIHPPVVKKKRFCSRQCSAAATRLSVTKECEVCVCGFFLSQLRTHTLFSILTIYVQMHTRLLWTDCILLLVPIGITRPCFCLFCIIISISRLLSQVLWFLAIIIISHQLSMFHRLLPVQRRHLHPCKLPHRQPHYQRSLDHMKRQLMQESHLQNYR